MICHIKTFLSKLRKFLRTGSPDLYTSGHDFILEEEHDNVTVQILRCQDCGHVSIGWKK